VEGLALEDFRSLWKLNRKPAQWQNPPDAPPEELSKRTLTNLYNARPAWLAELHRKLDKANRQAATPPQ
jgi:hypothetical protein